MGSSSSDYQEVVVDERPGLPRDDLHPLRTALPHPLAAPTHENMVCKMPAAHTYMTIIRNTIKRTTLKRIADTFVITGLLED